MLLYILKFCVGSLIRIWLTTVPIDCITAFTDCECFKIADKCGVAFFLLASIHPVSCTIYTHEQNNCWAFLISDFLSTYNWCEWHVACCILWCHASTVIVNLLAKIVNYCTMLKCLYAPYLSILCKTFISQVCKY